MLISKTRTQVFLDGLYQNLYDGWRETLVIDLKSRAADKSVKTLKGWIRELEDDIKTGKLTESFSSYCGVLSKKFDPSEMDYLFNWYNEKYGKKSP